ncbi:hypothetical protein FH608_005735 [Nonomuraea phyllanthi]|uniref:Uncharacterized protein n=1 Tax=Nonomuraea phyllanthi TaxID=2219224 RepID=A0A5C4WRU1_9ACTN|nr:exo-alpha-sialidase [Nonomuraea phyllanthi]KAB8196273.1 hypothetical protein FH608_005735 [Nonomuraea phyllanthi]
MLLVNDHLLKQAWPGFVTGKLSDVAGLVAAPALVALLFWRRADLAATVLTGVLFALVKTTETGAEAASHVWTLVAGPSRVLADPTDLLALPALALAWWVRRRSLESGSSRWRVVVTMPLAVLAVTATSAAPMPTARSVDVDGDRITVQVTSGVTRVSEDGGATWSESYDSPPEGRPSPQSAACVPRQATRCYRLVKDRMAVEQSDDGGRTWEPSWAMSQGDSERMARRYSGIPGQSSMGLAVQARPGGHVVVVANGLDGILVRDVSGQWQRLGWPGGTEEPAAEVDLTLEFIVAIFLAACMLFGGVGAGLRRFHLAYMIFASAACLGLFTMLISASAPASSTTEAFMPSLSWSELVPLIGGSVLVTVVGVLVSFVLACTGRARGAHVAVGLVAAPLVFAGVYTPFYGWSQGAPGPYWVAVALAVLLTGLVVLAGALLIRHDARRRSYLDGSSTSRPT